ncbi:hypothetical protein CFP71_09980 [Amycolatopsis thailandensis]|uniref:Uncharacterized protein n=2 Tax=Amycolatopsis thailandensis TaxID=589330 RepID=A0A229SDY0_9PSEU|nr:hypothetical protein CFP71_09980 [Amycolatopsis thailandensis]
MHKKGGFVLPASGEFSSSEFQRDFATLQQLLAEAYQHNLARDGHCKSSEGTISLHFPEFFWSFNSDKRIGVEIFSYCFGGGRTHDFDTIDAALDQVREWHRDEMTQE